MKSSTQSAYLPDELWRRLREIGEREERSISWLLRRAASRLVRRAALDRSLLGRRRLASLV